MEQAKRRGSLETRRQEALERIHNHLIEEFIGLGEYYGIDFENITFEINKEELRSFLKIKDKNQVTVCLNPSDDSYCLDNLMLYSKLLTKEFSFLSNYEYFSEYEKDTGNKYFDYLSFYFLSLLDTANKNNELVLDILDEIREDNNILDDEIYEKLSSEDDINIEEDIYMIKYLSDIKLFFTLCAINTNMADNFIRNLMGKPEKFLNIIKYVKFMDKDKNIFTKENVDFLLKNLDLIFSPNDKEKKDISKENKKDISKENKKDISKENKKENTVDSETKKKDIHKIKR